MGAVELLKELETLGVSVSVDGDEMVLRPGARVPSEMMGPLRRAKDEIMAMLTLPTGACTCDPLPSRTEHGALAHAGCGPTYERCSKCGKVWQCKLCQGCRYCRTPG